MKILIAGLGSIGRRHLRNLVALGETDLVLLRTFRSTLPDEELKPFPVETDLTAALRHKPEAVIVSNPTALHLQVAIPAAQAGCHLLLEKPISHTLEGVEQLQAAVQHGGGQVLVGFQFRFHPGLRMIKRWLEENAIGQLLSARASWGEYLPGWHPWEDYRAGYSARADLGGGVLLTLCHPLDYLHWYLGNLSAVWAFTGQSAQLALEVEDCAEVGLKFDSGALGSVHLDYNRRPPAHRLELVGTEGVIEWDNADGNARLFNAASGQWQAYQPPAGFERNTMFLELMRHFISLCKGEAQSLCTLQDGAFALRIALAALESQELEKMIKL
jgi:predicted dehydrogenase